MADDRRLIEDYLPIQAISAEASREKSVRKGHISTLHLWWARRPLVACRAAVYGALVPATQFVPPNGSPAKAKSLGRANAAKFVDRLCKYPGDLAVIKEAQQHILEAHASRLSQETGKTVTVKDIEEGHAPRPKVLDMFAGGGAIPLEALRLGCDAYALDLNPVAHMIQLCTLVYPQQYGTPDQKAKGSAPDGTWAGLAKEVEYWGRWVLNKVYAEVSDLYPPVTDPLHKGKKLVPKKQEEFEADGFEGIQRDLTVPAGYLTPVAYLWTRTVKCRKHDCGAFIPLARQTWLSKKTDRYVALKITASKGKKQVRFDVVESFDANKLGFDPDAGSKAGNATCPFCGTVADSDYVKTEGQSGRIGEQLLAIACRNPRGTGNVFLTENQVANWRPTTERLSLIEKELEQVGIFGPAQEIVGKGADQVPAYGMPRFKDLFPQRARIFLLSIAKIIRYEVAEQGKVSGYDAYRLKAIRTCLGLALDRVSNYLSSLCVWRTNRSCVLPTFSRQALSMVWDYGEMNPFSGTAGDWMESVNWVSDVLENIARDNRRATVRRGSADEASSHFTAIDAIITDPPYYDNVIYSDLSDFFYVWLRLTVGDLYPEHFATELTPKKKEAVSATFRYNAKGEARKFYEDMMLSSFKEAYRILRHDGLLVCVYAHKTTLGWATLVDALRMAGFEVTEAWPIDTEMAGGMRTGTAALASSIFLVARKRMATVAGVYEEVVYPELEVIVRERVDTLWDMGISGADLVISAIGAGLRAFTKYDKVEYANGEEVPAEKFLSVVEGVVLETLLEKIFGVKRAGVQGVDGPTQLYVLWRYTYKAAELDAGEAIVFTYGIPNVELDGQKGLTTGNDALVEKRKGKYRLKDFAERGDDENLGLSGDDGTPAPLIDVLHRILYLMENRPAKLAKYLDEVRPNHERLRIVAQALAGAGLKGKSEQDAKSLITTTSTEQAALSKLMANWRTLVESKLSAFDVREQKKMDYKERK